MVQHEWRPIPHVWRATLGEDVSNIRHVDAGDHLLQTTNIEFFKMFLDYQRFGFEIDPETWMCWTFDREVYQGFRAHIEQLFDGLRRARSTRPPDGPSREILTSSAMALEHPAQSSFASGARIC